MPKKDQNVGIPLSKREFVRLVKANMNMDTPDNQITLDEVSFVYDSVFETMKQVLGGGHSLQTKIGLFKILQRKGKPYFDINTRSMQECGDRLYMFLHINDTLKSELKGYTSIEETPAHQNQMDQPNQLEETL